MWFYLILRLPCWQMPKSGLSYLRTHMRMLASIFAYLRTVWLILTESRLNSYPEMLCILSQKGLEFNNKATTSWGPFRVSRKIGNRAYAIDLPRTFHLHNVFHLDVLKKASPLQQGPLNVGHETEDAEGEEYIVEKISDVKLASFGRKRRLWLQFRVHYAGYQEPEWTFWCGWSRGFRCILCFYHMEGIFWWSWVPGLGAGLSVS